MSYFFFFILKQFHSPFQWNVACVLLDKYYYVSRVCRKRKTYLKLRFIWFEVTRYIFLFQLPRTRLHIASSLQKNVDLAIDLFRWMNCTLLFSVEYDNVKHHRLFSSQHLKIHFEYILYTQMPKPRKQCTTQTFLLLLTDRFAPFLLLFWFDTLNSLTWFIYFA